MESADAKEENCMDSDDRHKSDGSCRRPPPGVLPATRQPKVGETPMDVHIYIGVTDLEEGIAFYTQGLGLRFRRRLGPQWVELEGAAVPIFLDLVSNRPRDFSGPWTVHLDFITEDLDTAVRQAQDAGAVLDRALQEREWGRLANMTDPFGNSFDLIEFAPGGSEKVTYTP
jgi:predicted enzyme related to lactoylglutathione lyase